MCRISKADSNPRWHGAWVPRADSDSEHAPTCLGGEPSSMMPHQTSESSSGSGTPTTRFVNSDVTSTGFSAVPNGASSLITPFATHGASCEARASVLLPTAGEDASIEISGAIHERMVVCMLTCSCITDV